MPNITKRTNKGGSISYRFRVHVGTTSQGKEKYQSMTWNPPANMRPTTAEKEAQRQATLFEEKVRQGLVSFAGSTTFETYANTWVQNEPLAYTTRSRYIDLLKRINPAIGHIKLEKLQAHHLEEFYRNLAEPGIKEKGRFATSKKLDAAMKKRKLSRERLARMAGVAPSTVSAAARGQRVSVEKAEQISTALGMETKALFNLNGGTDALSPTTIYHHHQLICAILAKAKRERIIPFNVAQEHATAPKLPRKEAKYLDDEQAQQFLAHLLEESDIRVKTALVLTLFTGVRRGELCGLSWPDIDKAGRAIHVRRASQYQKGKGAVEVPTKNAFSVRSVDVPPFVVALLEDYRKWWVEKRLLWGSEWQGKQERLFVQDDGKPINPDTINYWMGKFLAKHDLPHVTPHSLRHTFATLQITAGVDIRTLQARTGHAQASTLINTYSHAIKSAQEQAAAALETVLLKDNIEA